VTRPAVLSDERRRRRVEGRGTRRYGPPMRTARCAVDAEPVDLRIDRRCCRSGGSGTVGPDGTRASRTDLPEARLELLPGGRLLLEPHLQEAAASVRRFLVGVV